MACIWTGDDTEAADVPQWVGAVVAIACVVLFAMALAGSIVEPDWRDRSSRRWSVVDAQPPARTGLVGDVDEASAQPPRRPKTPMRR